MLTLILAVCVVIAAVVYGNSDGIVQWLAGVSGVFCFVVAVCRVVSIGRATGMLIAALVCAAIVLMSAMLLVGADAAVTELIRR